MRVETGTPTTVTHAISTDAKGRYAVTLSGDKTARVWDIESQQLLIVLRPPIGRSNAGSLFAAVMSPDGETVAAGGITPTDAKKTMQIFLFSRDSGQVISRLNAPDIIDVMAFSPDGKWLAVGCKGGILRVVDWHSGNADVEPELTDTNADTRVRAMSWSQDNRLVTSSTDSTLRLYAVRKDASSKIAEVTPNSFGKTLGVAFAPSGREIAVGFDKPHVLIVDGQSLHTLFTPDTEGVIEEIFGLEPTLRAVAWSSDGRTLFAAGSWVKLSAKPPHTPVRAWSEAGHGRPLDLQTDADGVLDMVTLPGRIGGVLIAPGSAPFGIVTSSGKWRYVRTAKLMSRKGPGGKGESVPISSDGRKVSMGISGHLYSFDLRTRQLQPDDIAQLIGPRTTELPITNWPGVQPRLRGKALLPPDGDFMQSLAIAPDANSFVMGGVYTLCRWDSSGKLLWTIGASAQMTAVTIPTSNDFVIAAKGDDTFVWVRLTDGRPLLNLYVSPDGRRWVLWTPSGYYDASPGGEDSIGWHINRSAEQAADFFPASKFRARFYRPDIVDQVLETLDEGKAIEIANAARGGKPEVQTSVVQTLPPVLELVSPHELSVSQSQVSIRYRTRSADDAPVTRVFARVNGLAQPGARRVEVVGSDGSHEISIDMPPQDSEIQLFAENRFGASTAVLVKVKWAGAAAPRATVASAASNDFQIQPKLYVLAIGVSAYENKDIPRLTFAAKDAQDFAKALQRQTGKLYKSVEVKVLTDAKANKDDILDALDWLQKQVTQHDVGMLFLSGHGTNDSSLGYVYLPVNSDLNKLKRTAITMADITTTLNSVAGKALAFLDTCHSGNILGSGQKGLTDITGVINELASAENGVVVFSSSTGRQSSLEDASWNNGAFTKALVEGIDGKADEMHTGRVTYKMLDVYVTERVKALTKGKQSPVTQAPGGVNDFPLASVK